MITSLIGSDVTALAGQAFVVGIEVRDVASNLVPRAEVTLTTNGAVGVRLSNGLPYEMKKAGGVGAGKGIAQFEVTASREGEFELFARCGTETTKIDVKVEPSSIVAGTGGVVAVRGGDGRVYAIGRRAPTPVVINAVPACGGQDVIIIDV